MSWRRRGLASARTKDGAEVVGGRDELTLPDGRAVRWEHVLAADWESEQETLTILVDDFEVITLALEDPALLVQLVRERVTASVVLTRRIVVDGKRGFTVMARRPPSGGDVTFTYEYDRALDPDAPAVRAAAQAALRDVRDELGL